MTTELRKQMDADDLKVLERAADAELARLDRLHWECAAITRDPAIFKAVAEQAEQVRRAMARLRYLFIDQFPAGRDENDKAGRTGLPAA